jgi:DNA-binding SARP family transcriptional activator
MANSGLEFGLLGPLQMSANGAEVPLGAAKQRAVLAMLLINRNRPVATDSLIDATWRQRPPPEARASLHPYISNLRRLLSNVGVDPAAVLVSARPGYRLNVPDEACDLDRFAIEQKAGVRSAALREWRGPVFEPYREPLWAQLITAYYLAERQYDALDAYRRLKTTLADDLGIDPGPTLRGLPPLLLARSP